jgi:NADH:ubiquinone oxidoreductase subunit 2 (subunit N)
VVAFGYYGRVMREMWMSPVPEGADTRALRVPGPLVASLGITFAATIAFGVFPSLVLRFGDLSDLTGAFGG